MINENDSKYQELKKKIMETGDIHGDDYNYMYDHCKEHLVRTLNNDEDESFWSCIIDNQSIENYENKEYSKGINLMVCNNTFSGYFCGVFVTSYNNYDGTRSLVLPDIKETIGYKLNAKED